MSTPKQTPLEGVPTVTPEVEGEGKHLPREDIFDVLSNRRRRYVLHYLKQRNDHEKATLPELANHVAAWEQGIDVSQVGYDDRKSVQTSLYQLHLPKLSDSNLIEYDKRAGEVRGTEFIEDVDFYLETVPNREVSWPLVFVGVSTVGVALSIAVAVDALGTDTVPDAAWFVMASTVFLLISLWYTYHHRNTMRLGADGPPPECE